MDIQAQALSHEAAINLVATMTQTVRHDTEELSIYRGVITGRGLYVIIAPSGFSLTLPFSIHESVS